MLYMLSCLVLMITASHQMLQTVHAQLTRLDDSTSPRPRPELMFLWVAIAAGFSSPFMITILDAMRLETDGIDSSHNIRWTVYALLVSGGAACVCAALALRASIKTRKASFWVQGKAVALACAGFIGVVSAASHLMFFQTSQDGIANVELLRGVAPIRDMENCRSGVAFIQYREDAGPLTYRCPTALMLGGYTSQPFAPWPDYTQGESQDLATVIHDATAAAEKP